MNEITNNPLLQEFKTPHETAPFAEIKNKHFLPAFREAIKEGEAEVNSIVENSEAPTFENTVEALERTGRLLNRTAGVFFNLLHAETNDELQKLAQEVSPLLTKFENDIQFIPPSYKQSLTAIIRDV